MVYTECTTALQRTLLRRFARLDEYPYANNGNDVTSAV